MTRQELNLNFNAALEKKAQVEPCPDKNKIEQV